ncbi:MAG: glycosyltransferase family 2 protein [Zoogloea sp.]|nr:glycosyltransferase family 2 protein [Zoogloea sp.]
MIDQAVFAFKALWFGGPDRSAWDVAAKFFPFVLLLEFPFYLLVLSGMLRYGLRTKFLRRKAGYFPPVSCFVLCYAEGNDVIKTIRSLALQDYPGFIEIIAVIDGAVQNANTFEAARKAAAEVSGLRSRRLIVLPKWQRGGRVSSLNAGLSIASGEICMALDGDTSFDNDMVKKAARHFVDKNVVGVAGNLRVRNAEKSLVARLQALEYMTSISAGKTGLSEFNIVNNISGAFGVFRVGFIRIFGGWDAGTAEDLDMTTRIKQYFGRHPELRIVFEPHAVGHTDVPDTWRLFFRQRLRWDGDLFYLFIRKFRFNIRPTLLGWRNFFWVVVNGLMLQLTMPFLIVLYSIYLLSTFTLGVALGIFGFVYVAYLIALTIHFAVYVALISERPAYDAKYFLFLPIYPLFTFANRVHCAFSTLTEVVMKSHLDSSMAPYWVLKKTKF